MTERTQEERGEVVVRQEEMLTLFDMLLNSCDTYKDNDAYIYKVGEEEVRVSYGKLFEDVLLLSRAFEKRGLSRGDKVMFLSDNRYAWIVTDLALMSLGAVNVPRGSDTPTQELSFIVENSGATQMVVESENLMEKHGDYIKSNKQIKNIFTLH